MFLCGNGDAFDEALLAQGFSNIEIVTHWQSSGYDTAILKKKLSGRSTAGVTLLPKFLPLIRKEYGKTLSITADRLERIRPVLKMAQTSILGCIPKDSALVDSRRHGVRVHETYIRTPVTRTDEEAKQPHLYVGEWSVEVPEGALVSHVEPTA
jgi:hypothetical protein